jgi:protein required for attachment to host cells
VTWFDKRSARLARALLDGKTGSMTMVAPRRALGMMREAHSPAVRHAITREIAKDVVKLPMHEIEHMLTQPA